MFLLLASGLFLSLAVLFAGSLLAWLSLQPYVLQIFLGYGQDRIRFMLHLDSLSGNLLSFFLYNEDRKWLVGIRTPKRIVWQQTWNQTGGKQALRIWRRARALWRHPQRPAWMKAVRLFLEEMYEKLTCRRISLNVRMGLPSYPQTGYLAAVAYPLNFTLFRCLGVYHPNIVPDFTTRGVTLENQIRFTFHGYQLLKPSYRFLSSPVVRHFLWDQISRRTHGRRADQGHSPHPA